MTALLLLLATGGARQEHGFADFGSGQTRTALAPFAASARMGAPQPGFGQAREERGFPPLPGEPHEGFRPYSGYSIAVRPSRTCGGPDARRRPLSGGCGASRPVSFFGTAIGVFGAR